MLEYFLAFLLAVILYGSYRYLLDKLLYKLPPGPLSLPFIGNFYLMGPKAKAAPSFREISKKYGPIFRFYLGQYRMIVLNTPEVIHEGIVGQSKALNSRPTFLPGFVEVKPAILTASGQTWMENRRFALRAMREFGMGKMSIIERLHDEMGHLLAEMELNADKPFVPHKLITNAVSNIICCIVFGKRFEYHDPEFVTIEAIFDRVFSRQIDKEIHFYLLPFLRRFVTHPQVKDIIELEAVLSSVIKTAIDEHRKDFDNDNIRDFPDLFIQSELTGEGMNLETFASLVRDLFAAGSETTATALNWSLLYLTKFPDIQKKCHEMIDNAIGTDRLPTLADRPQLTYIDAVMCEVMRHATIAPLSLLHANLDGEAHIQGYDIPQQTVVTYNIWALHHDEDYWKNPEDFDPNRWLDANGKLLFHSSHFMAFGTGPRICLGESLARVEYFVFLVSILQRFSFTLIDKHVTFDDGVAGISYAPPKFRVIPSKR